MSKYIYVLLFGWFLYRHTYYSNLWGRIEREYELIATSISSGFVSDGDTVRRVTDGDLNSVLIQVMLNSYRGAIIFNKLLSYLSAIMCFLCFIFFML